MTHHLSTTDLRAEVTVDTFSEPRERRAAARDYDAILLASFGGPEAHEDVLPFLRNVTRGRGIPDERLVEVGEHYTALGGRSPINDQNRVLIDALRAELDARGIDLPVYWGNRNWEPSMSRTVRALHEDGHREILALATSAYSSYSSCRQYREDFGRALEETGLMGSLRIDKARPYFNHPGFLSPMADGIGAALEDLEAEGHDRSRIRILFSTHSIPEVMADASGPEEERTAGPARWYVAQHEAVCRYLVDAVVGGERRESVSGGAPAVSSWELVYQSRSGPPQVPWLEPDINDVIARIARSRSHEAVIVVPVGFVSDHVEVIWDLDTEARQSAEEHGLAFRRVPTSGTDPRFVAALADLVEERMTDGAPRQAVTDFGETPDVCGTACCLSGSSRGRIVPTTSALDSDQDLREFRTHARTDGEQR
ncbi:ferrochelatase [Brachybacterium sp. P6-10-X1]|uniref:ferrochelatase n=1 Tax=Brachybacterium sp. P6-10-X1 TaxID=1903186 RepID=UPI000971B3B7|nr:ferrochelatase [Brachybacterium sp. P6-10-X1]APX33532.1 ferrochelatase [Brachybacterium sp. P6-10-X1]